MGDQKRSRNERRPLIPSGRTYLARHITHVYTGEAILTDVNFGLQRGAIHGLVGENGAGKSTLLKILTGAVSPTEGQLFIDDHELSLRSPADARALGVGAIHQDVNLFPYMDVATNAYGVGRGFPRSGWLRRLDWDTVVKEAQSLFDRLGVRIPVKASLEALTVGEQRMVEIVRALMDEPRFLVVDEVTAALDPEASRNVLNLLMRLRDEHAIGICFVSHRLDEVKQIADQVTVLRDGKVAGVLESQPRESAMIELMLGAARAGIEASSRAHRDIEVSSDSTAVGIKMTSDTGKSVALSVKKGEIFGLTGTTGSGAHDVVRMLGGAQRFEGEVELFETPQTINSPKDAIRLRIGFVPGDRKREAIIPDESVATNIFLPSLGSYVSKFFLRLGSLRTGAIAYCKQLDIRTTSVHTPIRALSGGNQQKTLIARLLALKAGILALEEPTHGVDVGAKAEIHGLLVESAKSGAVVILACTDVSELVALCDRVAVFRHGEIVGIVSLRGGDGPNGSGMIAEHPEKLINSLMAGVTPAGKPVGGGV